MTVLHWQLTIAGVLAAVGLIALFARRVLLFKALLATGAVTALLLQLGVSPVDRQIARLERQSAGLPGGHPRLVSLDSELSAAVERRDRTTDQIDWQVRLPVRLGLDLSGGTEVQLKLTPDRHRIRELAEQKQALLADESGSVPEKERQMQISMLDNEIRQEGERVEAQLEHAVDIIRHRLSGIGLHEVAVSRHGTYGVTAQFPGLDESETERIIDTLQQQGQLSFRLVAPRNGTARDKALYRYAAGLGSVIDTKSISTEMAGIPVPVDKDADPMLYDWLKRPESVKRDGTIRPAAFFLVEQDVQLGGENILFADAELEDRTKEWHVAVSLDKAGARKFEALTSAHRGRQLAIVLDGSLIAAPYMTESVDEGRADVVGDFDQGEAEQLAVILKSGSLKVAIEKEYQTRVGPTLGEDSIHHGLWAMGVALILVVLFMLWVYRAAGVTANLALLLNLLMVLSVLSLLDAALTLPGMAGLILTLGMTVDANVLIFERIREERARGGTLHDAIALGYERAFITIMDANVTTLIAAVVLYMFGTDAVRGFALTLAIGIVCGMFCSLVATRWIFDGLMGVGLLRDLNMRRLLKTPSWDYVGRKHRFGTVSIIVVILACLVFGMRERQGKNYACDLTGGALLQVALDTPLTTAAARKRVEAQLGAEFSDAASSMQSFGAASARDESGRPLHSEFVLRTRLVREQEAGNGNLRSMNDFKEATARAFAGVIAPNDPFRRSASIGTIVAGEMKRKAILALIVAIAAMFVYIWIRFQHRISFGFGAVLALVHDVLITLGALALADQVGLLNGQIDLKIIAALLTIIGYSLNDTIVVFDRIRENMQDGEPTREVVNRSINETIGRTVITSLTTLLAVLVLFILGGEVIRGFAFALLVGVTAGTVSSILIASPVVCRLKPVPEKSGV